MNVPSTDLLRADLQHANYSIAGVTALWGDVAERARLRGVLTPAKLAAEARADSALATLARVFLLGESVPEESLDRSLPQLGLEGARALGLVSKKSSAGVRAACSLNPVRVADPRAAEPGGEVEWLILSDLDDHLRNGPAHPEHVMGVGGATRSLLAQIPFTEDAPTKDLAHVFRALDLGTGCGIVAMYLAHLGVPQVVATDLSQRALEFARINARLNGFDDRIDFRLGDLFDPVSGEKFNLIVSNPPFVITPQSPVADLPKYEYRDGGLTGDALAQRVVTSAAALLTEDGQLICLANWETPWGGDGLERVRGWITECQGALGYPIDAWVVERDRLDTAQYAETWARDGGARPGEPEFEALMTEWVRDFSERKVVSIGLGSIRLTRAKTDTSTIRAEQAMGQFAAVSLAESLQDAFDEGREAAAMSADEILDTYWERHSAVVEERTYRPGEESPREIKLSIDRPIGRRLDVDPLLSAALGACDGDLTLRQLADALATLLEVEAEDAATALVDGIRELAWCGMVRAADHRGQARP